MPTRTEAIKAFLNHKTHTDLASLYNMNMECQVNVAQDGGQRVEGEYKGRNWLGWTDGFTTWKPFRIPWNANTEPEFNDTEIKFDLAQHAEGIGMTGWDWRNRVSRWVGYDYDAIVGHSEKHTKKLTEEEFQELEKKVANVPWVTLRLSTSGKGRHLYVFLPNVPTANHTEHAALARAILGTLSGITGYDFSSRVDTCGGNMWVWHRKMQGTDGLKLLKQGSILDNVPLNWRDHLVVVGGKAKRTLPQFIVDQNDTEILGLFEEVSGQHTAVPLDAAHLRLMDWIREHHLQSWWDADRHMLVTHTAYLRDAHTDLGLKGIFKTVALGTEYGHDHNCYMYPMRHGAWVVRRYAPGVAEAETWTQDNKGWTRCFYNQIPDFDTACRASGGLLNDKGSYSFTEAELAINAMELLGASVDIATYAGSRKCTLRRNKYGKLVIEIERAEQDNKDLMKGWLQEGTGKRTVWQKVMDLATTDSNNQETEVHNYDDIVRHLVSEDGENRGWMVRVEGDWKSEPLEHVKPTLAALGASYKEIGPILGTLVLKSWTLVNRPFQSEYPEGRCWNRGAAQLAYAPNLADDRSFPTWNKILHHIGQRLDNRIQTHPWAKENGIYTGADYLKCWIASIIQFPMEQLPFLFLYSLEENTGKSIFHEAISLLFTRGVVRADNALISPSGFNAEIEHAVLCVVEETNLSSRTNIAYNRLKDWMMTKNLPIHRKGLTPYSRMNSTHWIQTANDPTYCPVFPGDTRITMINVPTLDPAVIIPKRPMLELLRKEAPDFLGELMLLEIPPPSERLNIPVIVTEEKEEAQLTNMSPLELFIKEHCFHVLGSMIPVKEFAERFHKWLPREDIGSWSKTRIGRNLPAPYAKGNSRIDNSVNIINIAWEESKQPSDELVIMDGKIYTKKEIKK